MVIMAITLLMPGQLSFMIITILNIYLLAYDRGETAVNLVTDEPVEFEK